MGRLQKFIILAIFCWTQLIWMELESRQNPEGDYRMIQKLSPPAHVNKTFTLPPRMPGRSFSAMTNFLISNGFLERVGEREIRITPSLIEMALGGNVSQLIEDLKQPGAISYETEIGFLEFEHRAKLTFVLERDKLDLRQIEDLTTGAVESFQKGLSQGVSQGKYPPHKQFATLVHYWVTRTVNLQTYKEQLKRLGLPSDLDPSSEEGAWEILQALVRKVFERFPQFRALTETSAPETEERFYEALGEDPLLRQDFFDSPEKVKELIRQQKHRREGSFLKVGFFPAPYFVDSTGQPRLAFIRMGFPQEGQGEFVAWIGIDLHQGDVYSQLAVLVAHLLHLQVVDELQKRYPFLGWEQIRLLEQYEVIGVLTFEREIPYFLQIPDVTKQDFELDSSYARSLIQKVQGYKRQITQVFNGDVPEELNRIFKTPPFHMPGRSFSPMTNSLISQRYLQRVGEKEVAVLPRLTQLLTPKIIRQLKQKFIEKYPLELEVPELNGRSVKLELIGEEGGVQLSRVTDLATGADEQFLKGESVQVNYGRYPLDQQAAVLLDYWSLRTTSLETYFGQLRRLGLSGDFHIDSQEGAWQILNGLVRKLFELVPEFQALTATPHQELEAHLAILAHDNALVHSPEQVSDLLRHQFHRTQGQYLCIGFLPLHWEVDPTGTAHLANTELNFFERDRYVAWIGIDLEQGDAYSQLAGIIHHLVEIQVTRDLLGGYPFLRPEDLQTLYEWGVIKLLAMEREFPYFLKLPGIKETNLEADRLSRKRLAIQVKAHAEALTHLFKRNVPEELSGILGLPTSDAVNVSQISDKNELRTLLLKKLQSLRAQFPQIPTDPKLFNQRLNEIIGIITRKGFVPGTIRIKGFGDNLNAELNRFVITDTPSSRTHQLLEWAL